MTTATYRLPRPPSVNNLYYNTGYRGGRQISPHYKQWLNAASVLVMMQRIGQQRVAGPYTLVPSSSAAVAILAISRRRSRICWSR